MMTAREFCALARISTLHFHSLKTKGLGAELVRLGRSVCIAEEATQESLKRRQCGLPEMLINPTGDMK